MGVLWLLHPIYSINRIFVAWIMKNANKNMTKTRWEDVFLNENAIPVKFVVFYVLVGNEYHGIILN